MIIEAIVIGLVIGFLTNGRLHHLTETEFKGWTLIMMGALFQVVPIAMTDLTVKVPLLQWTPLAGLGFVLVAAALNWRLKGFRIILAGALLNAAVMALHGGKMPIHLGMMDFAGMNALGDSVREGFVVNYIDFEQSDLWLRWLGKVIPVPKPYPLPRILSIGDLIITLGVVRFVQGEMVKFHFRSRGRMIRYHYRP